ncbi:MAG: flagellar hook protein FlgE [Bryobacteraceae bacterium]|jgi:flagellar hook protein FlgE
MMTALSTALTGLDAASTAVSIVGNNLANLNTTGYKDESVQFSDIMSQALGSGSTDTQMGMGVGPAQTVTSYTQGAIQQTSGAYDAAINGEGFFVVQGQNNQQLFTRDGAFSLNSTGGLVTAGGDAVQGWNMAGGVVNTNSPVEDIVVPEGGTMAPVPTANMSLTVNLDSAGALGASSGTYSTPIQVVDSQGGTHTLTATFTMTGTNAWSYAITVPAADLTKGGSTTLATGALTFDGTGQLTSPAATASPIAVKLAGLADGASDMTINWNLYNGSQGMLTQFDQASSVSAATQDGIQAGQVNNVSLANGGLIVATYSNGQQVTVGQVALAGISNPESLVGVGGNNLQATAATAVPAIGTAGTGGRGQIMGGSLESSTADVATEFTNLISYERTYQANSRMITTSDQMIQDLIGLIR